MYNKMTLFSQDLIHVFFNKENKLYQNVITTVEPLKVLMYRYPRGFNKGTRLHKTSTCTVSRKLLYNTVFFVVSFTEVEEVI